MKPSIGRIVIVRTPNEHNGTREHPAIVNRVWGDGDPAAARGAHVCVNVTVLPDCSPPHSLTSVAMYSTREEAEASGSNLVCWWPERV